MSIRRDEVNLILTIDGKPAARTLQDMEKQARDLRRALQRMDVDSEGFKKGAAELRALDTRIKETKSSMAALKQESLGLSGAMVAGFTRLLGIFTAVWAGIQAIGSALRGAANLEQLNISFETFLGNAETAKRLVQELRQFADVTPFETEQVNNAGRALLAFGFSAQEIIPTLTRVGDVAAATGKDFNELALIYGKARAEGLIQNDTLNQLAEAGIPIYAELAKVMETTEDKIRKMSSEGKIQFENLQQVFVNLTSEGGRFAGLMESQSQSLTGLGSTLVSALQNMLTALVEPLIPLVKSLAVFAIEAVTGITLALAALPRFVNENRVAIGALLVAIVSLNGANILAAASTLRLAAAETASTVAKRAAATAQWLLNAAMTANPIGIVVAALAGLVAIFSTAYNGSEKFRASIEGLGRFGREVFAILIESAQAFARGFSQLLDGEFSKAAESFAEGITKSNPIGIAFTQGERLGKAFSDGYNSSIDAERAAQREKMEQEDKAEYAQSRREYEEQLKAEEKQAADEQRRKAEADKKAREEAKKRADQALETALKAAEVATQREELLLENQRIRGEITEAQYQNRLLDIQEAGLNRRLEVFRRFHREQELEALEAQNKMEQLERNRASRFVPKSDNTPQPGGGNVPELAAPVSDEEIIRRGALAELPGQQESAERALAEKFNLLLDKEQEYELARLEMKRQFLEEELALLRASVEPNAALITEKESQKRDIELAIGRQRLENEQRTAEAKRQIEQASLAATADFFNLAADLLSADEKTRKKNASAIKAFQAAQVITNGVMEVQKIWASIAQYWPAGPAIGAALTAVAVGRTALALGKINATKFAGGGYTPAGWGVSPDSTGHRPVGVVHANEWVSPPWMTKHPVYGAQIAALETVRRHGFADGGYATTPTVSIAPGAAAGSAQAVAMQSFDAMVAEFRGFRAEISQWQRELNVPYTKIEEVGKELNSVRVEAAL